MTVEIVYSDGITKIKPIEKGPRDEAYHTHIFNTLSCIGPLVVDQLQHQFDKHGYMRHDFSDWNLVITEEVGEVAQAYLHKDFENVKFEITQTIACYVRLFAEVERIELGVAKEERDWYTEPQ